YAISAWECRKNGCARRWDLAKSPGVRRATRSIASPGGSRVVNLFMGGDCPLEAGSHLAYSAARPLLNSKTIVADCLAIPLGAGLGDALLRGKVHPHHAKTLGVALRPLKIVHQAP